MTSLSESMIIEGERAQYLVKYRGAKGGGWCYPVVYSLSESKNPINYFKKRVWPRTQPKKVWKPVYAQVSNREPIFKAINMHRLTLYPWYLGAVQEYETRLKLLEDGLGEQKKHKLIGKGCSQRI